MKLTLEELIELINSQDGEFVIKLVIGGEGDNGKEKSV